MVRQSWLRGRTPSLRGKEALLGVSSLGSGAVTRAGNCELVERLGGEVGSDFLKSFEKAPNMCSRCGSKRRASEVSFHIILDCEARDDCLSWTRIKTEMPGLFYRFRVQCDYMPSVLCDVWQYLPS